MVHFGPPSQPLWAPGRLILANSGHSWAPRRPMSVKLGTLTRSILVATGAQKGSILVTLEAVGGPNSIFFWPPSQPLWAPGQPIFANLAILGAPRRPISVKLGTLTPPIWVERMAANLVDFGQIGGGRWANFAYFPAVGSTSFGPMTAHFCHFWPFSGRQDARFRSNLERQLDPSLLTQERKTSPFWSNWRRPEGQLRLISGQGVGHFGPRDSQFGSNLER